MNSKSWIDNSSHDRQQQKQNMMMKKTLYIFACICLSAFSAALLSCSNEEDDLFPESAAQRINNSVAMYDSLLQNSKNGWVMEYLPADGSYGGYIYTFKFNGDDVTMRSSLALQNYNTNEIIEAGTPMYSKFDVKGEQGAMLTFDTYNLMLHFWSEPRGSSDTDGYSSDYEFLLQGLSANKDTIYLHGKKYGNDMVMYRLKDIDDSTFIAKATDVERSMTLLDRGGMKIGDKNYRVVATGSVLRVYSGDSTNTSTTYPVFYTPEGFHTAKPFQLGDNSYQYFVYDTETGVVSSTDHTATLDMPSVEDQFLSPKLNWCFQGNLTGKHEMSEDLWKLFQSCMQMRTSTTFSYAFFGKAVERADTTKRFKNVIGFLYSMSFFGYLITQEGHCGVTVTIRDGNYYFRNSGAGYNYPTSMAELCDPFINALSGGSPYKAEFNDGLVKREVKFTSIYHPNTWFTLKLNSYL